MTPRRSVRAETQRLYREMAGKGGLKLNATTPTPDPSPQGGGEQALPGAGASQDLMAQVRALYEGSAVPVREIARRAGVSERTLYKYARKNNWTPRYAWMPDGARPPARPGRRRWTPAQEKHHARAGQFAPGKGAGGRFIRRDDIGKPFARGIKALDPAGRAAAAVASAEAARLAERARREAEFERAVSNNCDALRALRRAADDTRILREPRRAPSDPLSARIDAAYFDALLAWVGTATAAFERTGVAMLRA